MGLRVDLHELLCDVFNSLGLWLWDPLDLEAYLEDGDLEYAIEQEGKKHVYFQIPASFVMKYPCIVYERYSGKTLFADNDPYGHRKSYTVTVIDKNPDSKLPDEMAKLRTCVFNRHFTTNNLHHYVFNLYF